MTPLTPPLTRPIPRCIIKKEPELKRQETRLRSVTVMRDFFVISAVQVSFHLSKAMASSIRKLISRSAGKKTDVGTGKATDSESNLSLPTDNSALGLKVLVEGENPIVDIVAVHGLNGHREATWTAQNGINWLQHKGMLPARIPNARIFSWGYDANTHSTSQLTAMYLYDHAQNLVSELSLERRLTKTQRRPIIFVAHSLGGIVALIYSHLAHSRHLPEHRAIKTCTYGIIFIGTPHQGGEGVAWGQRLVNVASIFVNTNDKLLNALEKDSEALQNQLTQYTSISTDFMTKFAFETCPTPLVLGKALMVVPKSSAVVPGAVDTEAIAIMDSHTNMVKFALEADGGFRRIAGHLMLMIEEAPAKVLKNWETEGTMENALGGILKPDFGIPFDLKDVPTTSAFFGRDSDLNLMRQYLTQTSDLKRRKICVLYGLGGIGKTQLAIEYARLHKYEYTSVFWLDGKTEESLIQSLLSIAPRLPKGQTLNLDIREIKGIEESREKAQEVLKWFTFEGNSEWLLIFDNIDKTSYEAPDNDVDSLSSYDITQYFPRGDVGVIIITSRLQRLITLGDSIYLDRIDTKNGILILEKNAGKSMRRSGNTVAGREDTEIGTFDQDAVALVKRLEGLPLALVIAGSYIRSITVTKYLELYNSSWNDLHETLGVRRDYPQRTIVTTWMISFGELKRKDVSAVKLLQLWGYLDNQDLWFQLLKWPDCQARAPEWLRQITDTEITFLKTIQNLLGYSLIEQKESSDSYSMHVVVHDWIREFINKEDNNLFRIGITSVGLAVPGDKEKDYQTMQRRLLPHANRLSQSLRRKHVLDSRSNEIYDISYLYGLHNLGDLYSCQEKFAEPEAMYQRALTGYEKVLGPEHTSTLRTVNNLGILYQNQGKLAEAEAMYQRALAGKEKVLGPEHTSTLRTVNNLGNLYQNQGKLAEAEAMYQRALAGLEKVLGPERTSMLDTVSNLGVLYWGQGKRAEAEAMCQRALAGFEKVLGPEHTSTLDTVNNLGVLYRIQGKLAEAETMCQRALAGFEKALGPEHTPTLDTVNNLGILYRGQGKLAEAEAMYQRALAGFEKVLGPEHTSTLRTVNNLGILYQGQGKLAEAEAMCQRALAGFEKALGPEHTSTLQTVNNLSNLYRDQGRLAEAEAISHRAQTPQSQQ
ncbi:MAG: hypothetical protein M1813_000582 [Trichoglossum hirsutum]|nr:MAG: hypothetical protein M1813_000582 [Trichoglossum hirsutum]